MKRRIKNEYVNENGKDIVIYVDEDLRNNIHSETIEMLFYSISNIDYFLHGTINKSGRKTFSLDMKNKETGKISTLASTGCVHTKVLDIKGNKTNPLDKQIKDILDNKQKMLKTLSTEGRKDLKLDYEEDKKAFFSWIEGIGGLGIDVIFKDSEYLLDNQMYNILIKLVDSDEVREQLFYDIDKNKGHFSYVTSNMIGMVIFIEKHVGNVKIIIDFIINAFEDNDYVFKRKDIFKRMFEHNIFLKINDKTSVILRLLESLQINNPDKFIMNLCKSLGKNWWQKIFTYPNLEVIKIIFDILQILQSVHNEKER